MVAPSARPGGAPGRRRRSLAPGLALVLLALAPMVLAHPADFRQIVDRAGPSVVNIQAIRVTSAEELERIEGHRDFPEILGRLFGGEGDRRSFDSESIGSGFIVSRDGLVVTNHHVVAGATELRVRLDDRREFPGTVLGSDPATDIALLRIPGEDLPVARIGRSDTVAVGDWVVAIGSPFNFENTVTAGILSARGRSFPQQQYVPFLQTDVPINRGNSGGPLLDLEGRVIGVNSQIFSENGTYMGLSFSIPIELAMAVVRQLEEAGRVDRGLLGVGIEDVTRDLSRVLALAEPRGAAVTAVSPGSAADAAGVEVWDVILAVDGQPVERFSDLPPMIGLLRPGTPARLTVARSGRELALDVVIGSAAPADAPRERPAAGEDAESALETGRPARLGLVLAAEGDELRVEAVEWDPAWRAGLRPGQLVHSVNRRRTPTLAAFDAVLADAGDEAVALLVRRGATSTFVIVPAAPSRAP